MNKKHHKRLNDYVRDVADHMELRDWEIVLSKTTVGPPTAGECEIVYGRKYATIRVAHDFRSLTPKEQRHIIVHELVHCHFEPIRSMVRLDLEEALSRSADQLFWNSFRRQSEFTIDAIASALAKHLPLP